MTARVDHLPSRKRFALFRAAALVVGDPGPSLTVSYPPHRHKIADFLSLAVAAGEEYRSYLEDAGAAAGAVRLSILWGEYQMWYRQQFAHG